MSPALPTDAFNHIAAFPLQEINKTIETMRNTQPRLQKLGLKNDLGRLYATVNQLEIATVDSDLSSRCRLLIHLGNGELSLNHAGLTTNSFTINDWILVWQVDLDLSKANTSDLDIVYRDELTKLGDYSVDHLLFLLVTLNLGSFDIPASTFEVNFKQEPLLTAVGLFLLGVTDSYWHDLFAFRPPVEQITFRTESVKSQLMLLPPKCGIAPQGVLFYVEFPTLEQTPSSDQNNINTTVARATNILSYQIDCQDFWFGGLDKGKMIFNGCHVFDQHIRNRSGFVLRDILTMLNSNFYSADFNGAAPPSPCDWVLPGEPLGPWDEKIGSITILPKQLLTFEWSKESESPEAKDWLRKGNVEGSCKVESESKQVTCEFSATAERYEGSEASSRTINIKFTIWITMDTISPEGKIQFGVTRFADFADGTIWHTKHNFFSTVNEPEIKSTELLKKQMKSVISHQVTALAKKWEDSLNKFAQFRLSGDYLVDMRSPRFNAQGDLVVNVEMGRR